MWSGDINCTFDALQVQVRAGLNMAMSGIPWWTTDIGGFCGDPDGPAFRELIIRWFQYGVFCPLFRLHGHRTLAPDPLSLWERSSSGGPNEAWSFGDEAYAIIRELLFLRERLRPYVMAQMQPAQDKECPPMRPLFFDYPDDAAAPRSTTVPIRPDCWSLPCWTPVRAAGVSMFPLGLRGFTPGPRKECPLAGGVGGGSAPWRISVCLREGAQVQSAA